MKIGSAAVVLLASFASAVDRRTRHSLLSPSSTTHIDSRRHRHFVHLKHLFPPSAILGYAATNHTKDAFRNVQPSRSSTQQSIEISPS